MKLEVKHLAAYLPYGLQCEVVNWSKAKGRYETHRGTMCSVYSDGTCTFQDLVESDHGFHSIKPILRPIFDIKYYIDFLNKYHVDFGKNEGCLVKRKNETFTRLNELDFLFKNHIDVFGLIDEGLAIDVNTLNQK